MKDITLRLTNILYQKEKVRGYLGSFQETFDAIERAVNALKNDRWIDTAVGVQLDGCGQIVDRPRDGMNDDDYREAIRYRVFVNLSEGSVSDINKAVRILTKPEHQHYWESYPACYVIFSDGDTVPDNIRELLKDISPAGIGVSSFHSSYGEDAFFLSKVGSTKLFRVGGHRLSVNGKSLSLGEDTAFDNGSYLGGLLPPKLRVNDKYLTVAGKRLRIGAYSINSVIDSGTHLAGAFEI